MTIRGQVIAFRAFSKIAAELPELARVPGGALLRAEHLVAEEIDHSTEMPPPAGSRRRHPIAAPASSSS
jgi:hypothetical protein